MSVTGGPSRPTITVLNNVALAGSGFVEGDVAVGGAQYAYVEWVIGSADAVTVDLFAGGPDGDSTPGYLYDGATRLTVANLAAGGNGRGMLVRLGRAVGTLRARITNNTVNATTATVTVTLGY